jgi:hypothetical protein
MQTSRTIIAAIFLAAATASAAAGEIVGGSQLLDHSAHSQLERWLGAGQFNLNNVYTREAGDTSIDFHAGADGKGATFTLMRLTNAVGDTFLVGGYNPQSWSSVDGWHITPTDGERTGFLFNMTVPAVYRQVLNDYVLPSQGARQTFNGSDYGPTFGTGHDLYVNRTLDVGISWQVTYGDPKDAGASIVDRSLNGQVFHVEGLEVFAISPVPEPAPAAMLIGGIGMLGLLRRRAKGQGRAA